MLNAILWQLPGAVHDAILKVTGLRLVRKTKATTGELIGWEWTRRYPPQYPVGGGRELKLWRLALS